MKFEIDMMDLADELWVPMVKHENLYLVSNMGRVKSLGRMAKRIDGRTHKCHAKIMKPGAGKKSKYQTLRISNMESTSTFYVHHLVLNAFIGPPPKGMEACHNDGDRTNNRLSNLRWDTRKNNHADKQLHGTASQGEIHPNAKLTCDVVRKIRQRRMEGATADMLAVEFNVTRMTAYRAATGRSWKHLK